MSQNQAYRPSLLEAYHKKVVPALKEEFGYKNPMQVPYIKKIVISTGMGRSVTNKKLMDSATQDLSLILGQKPKRTRAKRSIASFKIRQGFDIGLMATLRGHRMYEFLERLINIAFPRVKDFQGISSKAFDGRGNYALGIKEHIIFPEIDYDKISEIMGFNIVVVTSAHTDEQAHALLKHIGMPFRR